MYADDPDTTPRVRGRCAEQQAKLHDDEKNMGYAGVVLDDGRLRSITLIKTLGERSMLGVHRDTVESRAYAVWSVRATRKLLGAAGSQHDLVRAFQLINLPIQ